MHQNKMTLDEHRELGKALQAARNMLVVNCAKLEKSYSKTKVPSLKLQKAAELMTRFEMCLRIYYSKSIRI